MIITINEWKKFTESNEWFDYEKDGTYFVGEHGLGCDDNLNIIKNYIDNGDIDDDHTWEYEIPEGSIVNIEKISYNDGEYLKITPIYVSINQIPFNTVRANKYEIFYSTEESVFGSGNIEYLNTFSNTILDAIKAVFKQRFGKSEFSELSTTELSEIIDIRSANYLAQDEYKYDFLELSYEQQNALLNEFDEEILNL